MSLPHCRTTTSARVTLQLEVNVGSWGPECDLAQVYRQASEGAIGRIRKALELSNPNGVRIVKVTSVDAITTSLEKR